MVALRDSRLWNRDLEGGLPDARLSGMARERTVVQRGRMKFERIYCVSCAKPNGGVIAEMSPHVFYLCDDCDKGVPPGCVKVGD